MQRHRKVTGLVDQLFGPTIADIQSIAFGRCRQIDGRLRQGQFAFRQADEMKSLLGGYCQ
jgi:hypothetical protein